MPPPKNPLPDRRHICRFCARLLPTRQGLRAHLAQRSQCRHAFQRAKARLAQDSGTADHDVFPGPPAPENEPDDDHDMTYAFDVNHNTPPAQDHAAATNPFRTTVEEVPDEGEPGLDHGGLPKIPFVEDYPRPAGSTYGTAETFFETYRFAKEAVKEHPWAPFADAEEWELAQWLMTSGLTKKAIEKFLKLKIVSSLCMSRHRLI